jgi:glycine/D-amino acid oxidase-like deaminating enzyme
MDLRTPYPYWLLRDGIIASYPSLNENIKTDVAIIGAGVAGALVSWYLRRKGFDVVTLDRRHVAMGSTAASTSLLQYETDTSLHELIGMVGEKNAVRSYQLGMEAIHEVKNICSRLKSDTGFRLTKSLQYASFKKHVTALREEFALRRKHGIALSWLDQEDVVSMYGFNAPGGLLSDNAAELDAYAFTHALVQACTGPGFRLFDKTEVKKIIHHKKSVELITSSQHKIIARRLVIACGYESQKYLPQKVQRLDATYAIASEPMARKKMWYADSLIWETARPYLYLRTTSDHRVIIGGKDDAFSGAARRDQALSRKARALEKSFSGLFPEIEFKTDFQWAGTFASTKDGLPFIGSVRQRPNTYFALGFGGNGITFSVLAGRIIAEILAGNKNRDAEIFSFDR